MDRPAIREYTQHIHDATLVSAYVFNAIAERTHRRKEAITLASVSIADINEALDKLAQTKQPKSLQKLRKELHHQLYDVTSTFLDDAQGSNLPPHRSGLDMHIKLETGEDGWELQPPYGPLYDMSQEELLVLHTTLADLLDKG
jgi:hypothetical protein